MSMSDGRVLGKQQIFGSAPLPSGFNIVLMGDGFTAGEQDSFNAACDGFVQKLIAEPPFDELQAQINVFRVNVSSVESGADIPNQGVTVRSYFDSSFGQGGMERLLECNNSIALRTAADQVPQFRLPIVVVNSPIYGGSGGDVATFSMDSSSAEIAVHESGHTAFKLADEYPYLDPNETDHFHHPALEPQEPNVTTRNTLATLKWAWAVTPGAALPTMANMDCSHPDLGPSPVAWGTVGLFEGAHYYHCGAYRPEYDCKMRNLGQPFCAVCRQVIRARLGGSTPHPPPTG